MSAVSSYRIGSRASKDKHFAATSESSILRSLFELRKYYASSSCGRTNDCGTNEKVHLAFWNCRWSPRILHSLRKILERDGRTFGSIKFFDCAIQRTEGNIESPCDNTEELFGELLKMILVNNSTKVLAIRGGQLIKSRMVAASQHHQRHQIACNSRSSCTFDASLAPILREGLSGNTSLVSLKLSGLEFSTTDNNGNNNEGYFSGLADNETLRRLDISGSDLSSTATSLSDALHKNTALQYIRFFQSSLDDQSLAQLVRSVKAHPCLTTLDLSKNYLGARNNNNIASSATVALDAITELLQSNESKLEFLDLSHQYQQQPPSMITANTPTAPLNIESVEEEQEQYKTAFGRSLKALSTNTSLRKIDLSGNFGCLQDDSSVKALGISLRSNERLEYINISGCGVTSRNMASLGREHFPWFRTSLKAFVLFGCSESATTVTSTITEPQRRQLGCPYNTAQDVERRDGYVNDKHEQHNYHDVALAIEDGLLSNMALENLGDLKSLFKNFNGNDSTLRCSCERIQQTLNLNRGGRRALVEGDANESQLPVGTWSHLLARAVSLDYVYNTNTNQKGRSDESYQPQCNSINDRRKSSSTASSVVFALLRQGTVLLEH